MSSLNPTCYVTIERTSILNRLFALDKVLVNTITELQVLLNAMDFCIR